MALNDNVTETELLAEAARLRDEMIRAGIAAHVADDFIALHVTQARAFAGSYGMDPVALLRRRVLERGMPGELETPFHPSLYQYAGERSNMSESVRAKLAEARRLAEAGTDNEAVRQQTGWYRGMDGKWRYEIPDKPGAIKIPPVGSFVDGKNIKSNSFYPVSDFYRSGDVTIGDIRKRINAYIKDYEKRINTAIRQSTKERANSELHHAKKALTKLKDFSDNEQITGMDRDGHKLNGKPFILCDIYNNNELYEAYPELKYIEVHFDFLADTHGGEFDGSQIKININRDVKLQPRSLIHEIQHAIQKKEGFAKGGNLSMFNDQVQQEWASLLADYKKLKDGEAGELLRQWDRPVSHNVRITQEYKQEMDDLSARLEKEHPVIFVFYLRMLEQMSEYKGADRHVRLYERLAGEIEARDAASRAGMTDEQRVAQPPDLRDDAIVLFGDSEQFALRTKPEPKQTRTAYKLFRVRADKPGKLFPLFVGANEEISMGVWLDAEIGPDAGNGKVKSRLGPLAMRPGWHAGDIPVATHIGDKANPDAGAPSFRPENQVWAEVEVADDVDWQNEANSRARLRNDGTPVANTAHITDRIPEDGMYRYKTNPNMTGNWIISGAMKVNRILSDEEVARINEESGTADLPRQSAFDAAKFGFMPDDAIVVFGGEQVAAFSSASAQALADTQAFKNWFRDSKVVDVSGEPLVVYHGTNVEFDAFDKRKILSNTGRGDLGIGFYFSSIKSGILDSGADWYGDIIGSYYIKLENPFIISENDIELGKSLMRLDPDIRTKNGEKIADRLSDGYQILLRDIRSGTLTQLLQKHGFDGVIAGTEYLVFEPNQIKSIHNRGAFDPNDPRILYQSAYHGSPHHFDKFTLDQIGSGQGAQTFGWGLYFAGERAVAEYYRKALTRTGVYTIDGKAVQLDSLHWTDQAAILMLSRPAEYGRTLETWKDNGVDKDDIAAVRQKANEYKGRVAYNEHAGQLYKVDIPENDELLDWDKSLGEQSKQVREALKKIEGDFLPYDYLELHKDEPGGRFYSLLASNAGSPEAASKYLNSLGVKGIRYLDGISRDQGEGSSNFVILDDMSIDILEMYYQGRALPGEVSSFLGEVHLSQEQALIRLFEGSDLSTIAHESAHIFLDDLMRVVADNGQQAQTLHDGRIAAGADPVFALSLHDRHMEGLAQAQEDLRILREFANEQRHNLPARPDGNEWPSLPPEGPLTGEQWRTLHEVTATAFENYLMKGEAPNSLLEGVFVRIKNWLRIIYDNSLACGINPSPEVAEVFDRMLTTDAAIHTDSGEDDDDGSPCP
jgi:hypothetical protein